MYVCEKFDYMENFATETEIWKDIKGFEGLYQVSNLGRVKSLERIDAKGNKRKERILKSSIIRNGYYLVCLHKQSIQKSYYIHRLVYEAFNGQIPEGLQVNHINEVKTDNKLENLNLMTRKENINWGTRNERAGKVLKNGKKSKSVLQFDLNDNFVKEYPSTHQVERELGFANGNIVNCCNGKLKTAYNYKWKYAKEVN